MIGWQAVAYDQGKEVCAEDAEYAAQGSANQPFQTDPAQLPFEQNNGQANGCADDRFHPGSQIERLNEVTSNSNNKNEKNTDQKQIHDGPPRNLSLGF